MVEKNACTLNKAQFGTIDSQIWDIKSAIKQKLQILKPKIIMVKATLNKKWNWLMKQGFQTWKNPMLKLKIIVWKYFINIKCNYFYYFLCKEDFCPFITSSTRHWIRKIKLLSAHYNFKLSYKNSCCFYCWIIGANYQLPKHWL